MARKPLPPRDPAEEANKRILAEREQRLADQAPVIDLGLNIQAQESQATSAAEFLADEFDKKNFGAPYPTITRTVYGPDPLLKDNPEFRLKLEQYGLEETAERFAELIRARGGDAVPDPIMKRGLRAAIAKFGVDQVAEAFRDRVLRIPARTVEVEVDRPDEMLGQPLDEAVERYGEPGFSYKFLSARCMDVLGKRGYELVLDERGDPVKVGTLFMGKIPEHIAARRREHFAAESRSQVREMEEAFQDNINRAVAQAGPNAEGSRALRADEVMVANATEEQEYLGQQRPGGVQIDSQW